MSKSNSPQKILFLMTGSIACFKACQVVSKLVQNGFEIQVVMSASALQFVGAATLEGLTNKPVVSDLFAAGNVMDHIHLVRWADAILVAPATANFINKSSQGIGDDLLTTMFLAHDFKKPFMIAPAMNTSMYLHPVTQKSIKALREMGISILETASGVLACGEVGWGRLLEPDLIVEEVKKSLHSPLPREKPLDIGKKSENQKILITSGGTEEAIDSVRSITNKSTGATGAFLADHFSQLGFDVVYLHAKSAHLPTSDVRRVSFVSFNDLQTEMWKLLENESFTSVIHAAAVSDFSLEKSALGKISSEQNLTLSLKKNPKLVNEIKKISKNKEVRLVGFKMTAQLGLSDQQAAVEKLFAGSHAEIIVHNDVSEFKEGKHPYHLYTTTSGKDSIFCQNKSELAQILSQKLLGAYL